jgi:ABC-type antimicrobial peptide transport system permease subunit
VSAGLFGAMGTPIIKGRDFGSGDLPNAIPVAIVNKVFVDKYLKGRDPIGVQFSAGYPQPDPRQEVTIVGVIGDVRQKSLGEPAEPTYYQPLTQFPLQRVTTVVSMSQSDPTAVESAIRAELRKLNPTMAIDFQLATDLVSGTLRRQELGMALMLVFGGIAIVLAAVGIYGVVSYAGSLRREEMATRLALGASPRSVFLLVMKQGAILGLMGAGIGIALSYFSGQLISNRVYAIRASDPVILAVATLLITAITVLATIIPASRAARLNPANALQTQ